jgi:hypothetical protein
MNKEWFLFQICSVCTFRAALFKLVFVLHKDALLICKGF